MTRAACIIKPAEALRIPRDGRERDGLLFDERSQRGVMGFEGVEPKACGEGLLEGMEEGRPVFDQAAIAGESLEVVIAEGVFVFCHSGVHALC